MNPVAVIEGTIAPLPRAQVDTDQIIPKQFLKRTERTGFGEFLFYEWARDAEGEKNPDFVLNRPQYRTARVLVAGPDFGTGSSREHAPWAIADWGFQAVVAPSFGDIFRTNCYKTGLLAVELTSDAVNRLLALGAEDPAAVVTIDLAAQSVIAAGVDEAFSIDPFAKYMLANGLDEIGVTMQQEEAISAYEAGRPSFMAIVSDKGKAISNKQ
jgi:3-isopropylmalate/(R)-2-methylmalate dehydratase small subunit